MNVKDCQVIHAKMVKSMVMGQGDDAYAWTRLLCRQLRLLTVKTDCTGTGEWLYVA